MKHGNGSVWFYLLMIAAMAGWGGSWVSAKVIAGSAKPELLVFLRYMITAAAFLPVLLIRRDSFRLEPKQFWSITAAAVLYASYSQFFFRGLETGLAGAGGVLLTTINPLFTYIASALLFRKRPAKNEQIGLVLGIVGGVLLLELWHFSTDQLIMSGNLYFLAAAAIWSGIALFSHESQKTVPLFLYSFYINGISGLVTLPFVDFSELRGIVHLPPVFHLNLLYLALIGTAFATTAYFFSTKKLGASKGSSFIFLVPVFAVLFSFLFLNEHPKWNTIVGGAVTVGAVWMIQKRKAD